MRTALIDWDPTPGWNQAHGMACAGILAASHNDTGVVGVCGSCRVIPVKIWYDIGGMTTGYYVAQAIKYAAAQGAKVISNSWGYPGYPFPLPTDVGLAINEVTRPNLPSRPYSCTFVIASGNDTVKTQGIWQSAKGTNVIAVGAIKRNNTAWGWSGWGSELDVVAPAGDTVEGDMWTTDQMADDGWNPYLKNTFFPRFQQETSDLNYTAVMGGTSGACPQVAGIAALVLSRRPDFYTTPGMRDTCHQIVYNIITKSAEDIAPAGFDVATGYGRANAYRALLSVIRGDVDNNGVYDIFDIIMEIDIAFSGGHATLDNRTADVNCDYVADVFDVAYLVDVVLNGAPLPPPCFLY